MTISEVAELMAQMKGRVSGHTRRTVNLIISLAMQYSYLGTSFTFDADDDLDTQVNLLLVQLSDAIMEETETRAAKTVEEEDRESALIYARRPIDGRDSTERLDAHCSDLKFALEGYLAVCFAAALNKTAIIGGVNAFLNSPNTWERMRENFGDNRYRATFVSERGFHFGKGMPTDPRKGMTLVAQTFISETYHHGVLSEYGRMPGIIGYRVHRGSTYDCEECDELCIGIHPIDDQVLPAHPRCMCYTTPVVIGEE